MAWSCIIAAGATIQMAVTIAAAVEAVRFVKNLLQAQRPNSATLTLATVQIVLDVINNFTADSLYLYRCYVIWNHRWKLIILPGLFMVSTLVVGLVGVPPVTGLSIAKPQVVYSLAVATNLVLTALTAGRLLWMSHATLCISPNNKIRARCNRAIRIVLESGALYCVGVIFLLVTASFNASEVYLIELGFGSQITVIIPTFTLVYVGLDVTVHKSHLENDLEAPRFQGTASRSVAVQRAQSTVLDFNHDGEDNKGGEYV
ncbi:hypothetical protein C8R45DRAFT_1207825 [Mycena sanguinolenta]|nr:hypothetical protein C8R45DRAFT_1207825 [Mycena sanguinolenta]